MIWLAVFVSDACIGYLSGKYFDARQARAMRKALGFSAGLDLCIGVNVIGFATQGAWMLVPSILGGLLGTWWSFRR